MVSAIANLGEVTPIASQTNPPLSSTHSAELAEAERLNQQVLQLLNKGKYSEAIPLSKGAIAISEKPLGQNHPLVATSLNTLALLYVDQGNYTQAEPLFQRSLVIREKALGKEHPDVARSLNGVALLYVAQNDIPRAIKFLNRSSNNIEEHNLALILTTGSEPQKRAYIATLSSSTDANYLAARPRKSY